MESPAVVHKPSSPASRKGLLFLSLFCLIAVFILFTMFSQLVDIQVHSYGIWFDIASAVLGIWLFILIAVWIKYSQRIDPFELPVWLTINIYVQVIMNIWLLQRKRISSIPWLSNDTSMLPIAVALFGVALTAMWVGYAVTYRWITSKPESKQKPKDREVNLFNTYLIWLVTWLISLYMTYSGAGSYLGSGIQSNLGWLNYFQFVAIVGSAATALLAIRHFREPSLTGWVWLAIVITAQITQSLIAGSKGFALFLVWMAMYYFYAKHRLPKRWALTAGLLVILLVPVVNRYREELHILDHGQGVTLGIRLEALENTFAGTIIQPLRASIESTKTTFQYRQGSMLDLTASALYLHPARLPFLGPEMAEAFVPQLIPRVLWPGKPLTRSPLLMITTVYGGTRSEHSFSTIGLVADAYRAGGWGVLIIIFSLLGAFMAMLYIWGPWSESLNGTVFYTALLSNIILYDKDITTLLVNLIQFGPLLWIIVNWFLFSSSHKKNSVKGSSFSAENSKGGEYGI